MTQPSDHQPRYHDRTETDDFRIRRLQQRLAAEEAITDATWEQGYRAGVMDRESDIPEELTAALRYGSAQQHVTIPIGQGRLTIVLAQDGSGHPKCRSEARAWKTIKNLYIALAEEVRRNPGVDQIRRHDLPDSVVALVWRTGSHVAVVVGRSADRSARRSVLRSRAARAGGGGTLAALTGWAIWKQLVPVIMGTALFATAAWVLTPNTDAESAPAHPAVHAPRVVSPWSPPANRWATPGTTPVPTASTSPSATGAATVTPQPAPSAPAATAPSIPPAVSPAPTPVLTSEPPVVKVGKPHRPSHPKRHHAKAPRPSKAPKATKPRGRRPAGLLGSLTALLGL